MIPGSSISEKTTLLIIISFNRLPSPSQSQQWEKHPNFLRQSGDLGSALVLGPGDVGLSAMIPGAPLLIFDRRWKTNSTGRFLTSYLPSQIGPRREGS